MHTPTPWKVEKHRAPNGGSYYRIYDTDDAQSVIAQVIGDGRIEYHDNAALIVKAVNSYEAMKQALRQAKALADRGERLEPGWTEYADIVTALALAGGEDGGHFE